MSKIEQIEQMAKHCHFYEEGKCLLLEDEAEECDTKCDMCEFAKRLYNAGYRKVPEGAMILTRAELDALNKYQERFKGQDAEVVIATEVAKEIFAEIEEKGKVDEPIVEYYILSYSELAELKKKYTEEGI